MAHGSIISSLVGAIALLLLPLPTWAQANDTAYCVVLGELVIRYAGSPGADGETRLSFAAIEAIDNCSKGNTAAGIKVLEQILRSNGFTLPKRTAPA
ncbi:MAG: hypothetical protein Q8M19_06780 [Reyranella sp.]|nr:hypothetical protein [Reyranella sp.]